MTGEEGRKEGRGKERKERRKEGERDGREPQKPGLAEVLWDILCCLSSLVLDFLKVKQGVAQAPWPSSASKPQGDPGPSLPQPQRFHKRSLRSGSLSAALIAPPGGGGEDGLWSATQLQAEDLIGLD